MGRSIEVRAADGHSLSAYLAEPAQAPRGGLVVLQEFFGVNPHIRRMSDVFAAQGFAALAPALFDRLEPGIELAYDGPGMARGRELRAKLKLDDVLTDVQAAIGAAAAFGPVAVLGYCWGGSLAYLSATRLSGLACAVGYYGAHIAPYADERAKVPVMLHFAETDVYIPLADVKKIEAAHPGMPIFIYAGTDHGFNCDEREHYEPKSAALAMQRSLEFISRHLADAAGAADQTSASFLRRVGNPDF
jgi:carboxymethylenebutenolidase